MDTLDDAIEIGRARRRLPDPRVRRLLREAAGVSQAELASVVGVSRPSVSRYETGSRNPRGRRLLAYLAALDRLRGVADRD
jgi:predicted transcriptional regulator